MKKQLTTLTCALALGLAAVCSSAAGQGAEATSQVGYAIARGLGGGGGAQAASAGGFGAAGAHIAQRAVAAVANPPTVIQAGVRTAFVARNVLMGARIGAAFGVWGGLPGLMIGGAVGAL